MNESQDLLFDGMLEKREDEEEKTHGIASSVPTDEDVNRATFITDSTMRTRMSVFQDERVDGVRETYVSAFDNVASKQSLQRKKNFKLSEVEQELLEKLRLTQE